MYIFEVCWSYWYPVCVDKVYYYFFWKTVVKSFQWRKWNLSTRNQIGADIFMKKSKAYMSNKLVIYSYRWQNRTLHLFEFLCLSTCICIYLYVFQLLTLNRNILNYDCITKRKNDDCNFPFFFGEDRVIINWQINYAFFSLFFQWLTPKVEDIYHYHLLPPRKKCN